MPVQNLAEFILYITPGFIAVEIYRHHFPAKERSLFTQIAQSVIWALLIVSAIRFADSTWLDNELHSNKSGIPDLRFSISLLLAGVLLGYVGVCQLTVRSFLSKKVSFLPWLVSQPDSIWLQVNAAQNEDWALVSLNDGSSYLGWISKFQADPNSVDQDFLLTYAKRVDENLKELYSIDGLGVYLNTRNVARIEFVKGK